MASNTKPDVRSPALETLPPPTANKRFRFAELLLVLTVAFSQSLLYSLYSLFGGKLAYAAASAGWFHFLMGIVNESVSIALLLYVLCRQGRTLREIGFSPNWRDIFRAVPLFVAADVVCIAFEYALVYSFYSATGHVLPVKPKNIAFFATAKQMPLLLLSLPYSLLNPFAEELIVRAYTISEVEFLTGKPSLAIAVSTFIQACYHLYQGIVPAVSYAGLFLVFSLYFGRKRRIMPVILAHLYFDVSALFLR